MGGYKHAGAKGGSGAGGECWGQKRRMCRLPQVCVFSLSPIQVESARLLGVRRSSLPNSGARCDGSFGLFGGSQPSLTPLRISCEVSGFEETQFSPDLGCVWGSLASGRWLALDCEHQVGRHTTQSWPLFLIPQENSGESVQYVLLHESVRSENSSHPLQAGVCLPFAWLNLEAAKVAGKF